MPALSNLERESWERDGFVIVPGFADGATCAALWERTVAISRTADAGGDVGDAQVLLEPIPDPSAVLPEEKVGKVFRLHHEPGVHADLAHDPGLGDLLGDLLGEDVDCFLSQFIFKNRRSLGQPLHQDAWYFRMTPSDQVGAWLAVTEATLENGPLWVLPGSHREPLHDVESDRRPGAQLGYVEITDHDIDGAIPVLLDPGDLLLFHAHLMHRSTDNFTEAPRHFPWHQDNGYTYVEPQQYLTCWVPLTDATVDNGCPWVVPGLHLGGTLAHTYVEPLGHQCLENPEGAVPVPAAAGGVVVFSSLTPHMTGPNTTDEVRRTYIIQYAPDGAERLDGDPSKGSPTGRSRQNHPDRQFPVVVGGEPVPA